MLTSLPFIACPTRCKERLSGLWLGVFFIHSKCTTPSLSKKPTCWNFSVKAMLGQLVSTGLPPWKRTNLNGVHQGCRPQHFLLRLPPPKPVTLESRRNQSPTDRVRAQWSITPHVGVSHPLPPPLEARGDYTVACFHIYIYYMHVFFSLKHATCMSLSGTGSSDDCSLTFLAYNSTYGLGYIQAWFSFI